MKAVTFARGPNLVQQERPERFDGAVEVVPDAPLFAASGGDQGAEFGLQQGLLPRLRAQDHDQSYGVFRELGGGGWARFAFRCALPGVALRHSGGIVLQDAAERRARQMQRSALVILASWAAVLRLYEKAYFSRIVRPAFRLSKFRIVFRTSEYVPRVSPR
jgi:hypothetical protein